jgi:hypothetical protein
MYASLLWISGVLDLAVFEQPARRRFFSGTEFVDESF